MNARDRALLFGRFGGGTLNTCDWREYASLSRLGLVDIDEGDGFADMLNKTFGMARQNGYRRVTITPRGRASALRQAEARVEELTTQAAAHLAIERKRNPNCARCLCGPCTLMHALAQQHAAMGWP